MGQIKTGKFIAEERKCKEFMQRFRCLCWQERLKQRTGFDLH